MKKCFLLLLLVATLVNNQAQISHTVSFTQAPSFGTKVLADGNTYTTINLQGAMAYGEEGKPETPYKTVQLLVPSNAKNFSVTINSYTTTTYNVNYRVAPAQEPIPTNYDTPPAFVGPDSAIYNSTSFFPAQIATIGGKGIFRGNHILSLEIAPIRYYPSQNRVEFYNDISLTVSYTLDGLPTNTGVVVRDKAECHKMLQSIVANAADINSFSTVNNTATMAVAKSASLLPSDCQYVVVTTRRLAPAFDEFVFWKTRKGVKTAVVTMEDIKANYRGDTISNIYDDAGKLRQFLFDAYNNGGGIKYALLAADSIPIRYQRRQYFNTLRQKWIISEKIPTDWYFSDFNSNWNVDGDTCYGNYPITDYELRYFSLFDFVDFYSEIYVGRIQPQNQWEVRNWTRKLLQYENNPGNGDFAYLTKGFYQQSDQSQQLNSARKIAGKVLWCPDTTVFEEEGGYGSASDSLRLPQFPKGKDFIDKFNEHFGFCGVFAHGSPTGFACATKGLDADSMVFIENSKYSVISLRGCYRTPISIRENGNSFEDMTNQAYPTIFYTTSCHTNSYDIWDKYGVYLPTDRSMGDVYTCVSHGGGPAYLGNTREGYFKLSDTLLERFVQNVLKGNYNVGIAEAMSKNTFVSSSFNGYDAFVRLGHNLTGCPEMEIWTAVPNTFSNVQITETGSTITVNTGGVDSCRICIMNPFDGGATLYEVRENSSSATFANVVVPYIVTITKHNYIPYLQDLPDEYIQNETFTSAETRIGGNIYAGKNVTTQKPQGDVIIRNGATLKLKAQKEVFLENGFEVENGGILEINTNTNN